MRDPLSPLATGKQPRQLSMKLTIIAMEIPYPPIHGGRVDIWRRIEAFKQLGVETQLICWAAEAPQADDLAQLQDAVCDLQLLDFTGKSVPSFLRRGVDLLQNPLGITSRRVPSQKFSQLTADVKRFEPDLLLIDGIHAADLAQRLSAELETPYVMRSHNIEHQHRDALFKAAVGKQKLPAFLMVRNLKELEFSTFENALAFFDISIDDLEFWKEQGFDNGYFLPPLAQLERGIPQAAASASNAEPFDIVFLGNLYTDNNVEGIRWFLTDVVPLLQAQKPDLSVLIAGSKPRKSIEDLCDRIDCVELSINPESAAEIYNSGRVLVNPIAVGGGVSIKSIDMLATYKPIVSLDKGIYGLPDSVKSLFRLAADAQSFADQVLDCLAKGAESKAESQSQAERRRLIDEAFGLPRVALLVQQLEEILERDRTAV